MPPENKPAKMVRAEFEHEVAGMRKFSKGGEAEPMGLGYQVHEENDDHFVVSAKTGNPFRVAKNGLAEATLQKIRAHHMAQGLYGGGEVKGYSGEDRRPDEQVVRPFQTHDPAGNDLSDILPGPASPQMAAAMRGAPVQTYGFGSGSALKPAPGSEVSNIVTGEPARPTPAMESALSQERTEARPQRPEGGPEDKEKGDESPSAPPPSQAERPMRVPGGGMGGLEKDLVKAGEAKSQAEEEAARITGEKALAQHGQLESYAQSLQENAAKRQAQYDTYQKRADEVAQAIANNQIDPSHYWGSRTTGQKIGSAIAMILGGIGSGITGRPNAAMEVFNQAIDRDIDAQKANLGKQQSLLSHYIQMGHNTNEAAQLAKADLRDYATAMMDSNSAKFAGPEAQALAKQHRAENTIETTKLRGALRTQAQEGDLRALEIAQKKMELNMAVNARPIQIAAEGGAPVPDQAGFLLDPKRRVKVPGGWAMANREEDAKEIADARIAHQHYESAIKEMEALKGETALMPGGALSRQGKLALEHFAASSKELQGHSGLARGAEEAQIEAALGNPTDLFRTAGGTQSLLNMARQMGNKHLIAIHQNRLIGGSRAAAGYAGGR